MSENRRSTTRYGVSIPADINIGNDGDDSHALSITNLSLGGAFVHYDSRLPIGTRVHLKFEIPGRTDPIDVGGSVRWVADSGAGVQFDGLRAGEVWSLNKYLAALAKEAVD